MWDFNCTSNVFTSTYLLAFRNTLTVTQNSKVKHLNPIRIENKIIVSDKEIVVWASIALVVLGKMLPFVHF
jgi:uncharacterized membrane protein YvbJ